MKQVPQARNARKSEKVALLKDRRTKRRVIYRKMGREKVEYGGMGRMLWVG
jgi:hypothetical protein